MRVSTATSRPAAVSTARPMPASRAATKPRPDGAASAAPSSVSVFMTRRSGDWAGLGFQQLPGVLAKLTPPFLVEPGRLQLGPERCVVDRADLQALSGEF